MKHRSDYKDKIKKHFNNFRLENSELKRRKSGRHQSVVSQNTRGFDTSFQPPPPQQQETVYLPSPMSSEISLIDNDLLASVNSYLLPSNAFIDMAPPQYTDINCLLGLNQFEFNQTVPLQQQDLMPVSDISQLLNNTSLNDYSPPQTYITSVTPPTHAHEWCEMPSRPKPPVLKNGPKYVMPSPGFTAYFHQIDADDSGTITFDELQDYLHNKDKNNPRHFNNEAVSTLIDMFDKSKLT